MTPLEAWLVTLIGTMIYLLAAYLISSRCLILAPIPLALFVIYPLLKRVTIWAHLGVGLALSMGPIGAWYAVTLTFEGIGPALVLGTLYRALGNGLRHHLLDARRGARSSRGTALPAGSFGWTKSAFRFHGFSSGCVRLLSGTLLDGAERSRFLTPCSYSRAGCCTSSHRKASDVELAFFKINSVLGFVVLAFVYAGVTGV